MPWAIRPARAADAVGLSELAEGTFRDAFAALNTAGNMDAYCAAAFSPAAQGAEIASDDIHTLVAVSEGRLVAFAQLHLHSTPPDCVSISPALELRRIYVERHFHGTGLARELLDLVLGTARARGAAAVWLGVWEHNPRAARFYQRSGFTEVGDHIFLLGTDPQRDLIMVCGLGA
jgi:GNAT superfamily N-acetyltransferase